MAKFVCTNEYDGFTTTDGDAAMAHLRANPTHKIVRIDKNATGPFGTGEEDVDTQVIETDEETR
jgi:hypothetical protein